MSAPQVFLSLAISLDGYIADQQGGVDWLQQCAPEADLSAFWTFFSSMDGLVIGSATYEQVLGFGDWPYQDKPCWVMSQRALTPAHDQVRITPQSPQQILAEADKLGLQRIWLVGGGKVNSAFEQAGLIDEYHVSIMPALLGQGVKLIDGLPSPALLSLVSCKMEISGVIATVYRRKAAQ